MQEQKSLLIRSSLPDILLGMFDCRREIQGLFGPTGTIRWLGFTNEELYERHRRLPSKDQLSPTGLHNFATHYIGGTSNISPVINVEYTLPILYIVLCSAM